MQHTLLTWIPAAYLLLSSVCLAVWYSGKPTVHRWSDKGKLNVAKLVRVNQRDDVVSSQLEKGYDFFSGIIDKHST